MVTATTFPAAPTPAFIEFSRMESWLASSSALQLPLQPPRRPPPRFLHRNTDPVQRHTNGAGLLGHLDGIDQGVLMSW